MTITVVPKESPIIFSTEMVKAIMAGEKTMTRRTVKNISRLSRGVEITGKYLSESLEMRQWWCPFGVPGDLLWVRETWATSKALAKVKPSDLLSGFSCEYKAGGTSLTTYNSLCDRAQWRPSIFLPKHASRIWLQVELVRVERLHDITTEDIIAEGVRIPLWNGKPVFECGENSALNFLDKEKLNGPGFTNDELLRAFFAELWCKMNGIESWYENPWVWVIGFKVVSTNGKI